MAEGQVLQEACAASVEKILEPLVEQISLLTDRNYSLQRPKGLSQNKATVLDLVKNAICNLMKNAEEVRGECPDVTENFQVALSEIQDIGENFQASVNAFLDNPEDEEFHTEMLRASRSLLSSVTRILILADLIDVSQLHRCLENIKGDAECVGILTDESELSRLCSSLGDHLEELQTLLKYRSQDLLGSKQWSDLSNSYETLTLACEMVTISTKASFLYPKLATLAANREFAVRLTNDAVDRLGCACDATYPPVVLPPLQGQAVAQLMQEVMKSAEAGVEKVGSWNSTLFQSNAQKLFTEIANLTQSAGLGDYFQAGIARNIQELNEAVDQFIEAWEYETSVGLQEYVAAIGRACANIRSLISQAALTLSASFFVTNGTVLSHLEESAKCANEEKLVLAVTEIQQTSDLIDSALCLCGVWTDPNTVRFVRIAANDLEQLTPQLINASKALALRSQSSLTNENFAIFLEGYKSWVQKLCDRINGMTYVLDFLEAHDRLLQEDIDSCQTTAEAGQTSGLINASRKLSARCYQAIRYIRWKLETSNEGSASVNQTLAALESIQEDLIPQFNEATREVCRSLRSRNTPPQIVNVRRIGEAIRDAFSGLRPLLAAAGFRQEEESSDLAETVFDLPPSTSPLPPPLPPPQANECTQGSSIHSLSETSIQSLQSSQPSPSRHQFLNETAPNQIIENFGMEHANLVQQIGRLEESGNDIMVPIVRSICFRLTEVIGCMTVPRRSALETDAELVQATREISWMTAQFNGKCEEVARGSPEMNAKKSLFTSLKNINIFSHELAVMSRVKADLKTPNSELCLDNVVCLVQSARNLMREVNKAISELLTITGQSRLWSATALPPVPPRPRRHRATTQSGGGSDCSNTEVALFKFDVMIDQNTDFSHQFVCPKDQENVD
ncbi:Catenin alpha [Taenia crassiceps]|uniref:Catenin alpha n=1 Tax=Taenia crassiceps TaxID=6207 RepID=A0ABR4QQ30_9CEST